MKKKADISIRHSDKGISFVTYPGMKRRILIADDDPGIRDIFTIIFKKAGYLLEMKATGDDLMKNAFTIPDIFLIDRQLSGMDGLEICQYLKSQALTRSIPVVMISASPDIGLLSRKAGADDYIEKPFQVNQLLQTIERNLNKSSLAGQLVQ